MKPRGFSLLEVLVAVTIIGVAFSLVFAAMSGSVRALDRVRANDRRLEMAHSKLAELDLVKKIRPDDSASGIFDDGTRWAIRTSAFIAPVDEPSRRNPASVLRIELTLEWTGRNGIQRRVLQTYRYQADSSGVIPTLQEQLRELE